MMDQIGPVETLARLVLQSDIYMSDSEVREAVDNVIGVPLYDMAPELYEAGSEACIDFKLMLENALHAAKTDPRWEGVYEKLIPRVRALEAALAKARGEA
jgi:hypothetical protein